MKILWMIGECLLLIIAAVILSCCSSKSRGKETNQLVQQIDSLLMSSVSNNEIPGASAYVSRNGIELYHSAIGWRNIEKADPLRKDDIFRMASMTKALTAVAVLQLAEKGKLSLDDELHRYIPEFRDPEILLEVLPDSGFTSKPANGEITIRQLLTHTSGIAYGFQDDTYNALTLKNDISEGFEDDSRTSMENILRLAAIPILFEPGEDYVYGMSYDVLGVIIEVVTGLRYDRYIERNILEPLKMKDSYFIVPVAEQHRLPRVYQRCPDKSGLVTTSYPDTAYPVIADKHFFSGGSDLCSTAKDYSKFLRMLMNRGEYDGVRVLEGSSVDTMLSKQTPFDEGGYDQGFAAWVINEEGAVEGSRGKGSFEFGGFYDTFCWTDPETGLIAVMLLQMYPNNDINIHQKFQDIIFRNIHRADSYPPEKK